MAYFDQTEACRQFAFFTAHHEGRMVDTWKDNEVVVSEAFAEAHRFKTGDSYRLDLVSALKAKE